MDYFENNMDLLSEKISLFSSRIQQSLGKKEYIDSVIKRLEKENESIKKKTNISEESVLLMQKTAKYAREQTKVKIEKIVTKCLQFVFERDFEFVIEFIEVKDIVEANFYLTSYFDGVSIKTRPEEVYSGGVIDVLSLALRIAFLELQEPPINGPLFLDEPGKHVSSDYIFNLGEFIKQSGIIYQRQILMVTHNPHLSSICDKSFLVEMKNGKSIVRDNLADSSS